MVRSWTQLGRAVLCLALIGTAGHVMPARSQQQFDLDLLTSQQQQPQDSTRRVLVIGDTLSGGLGSGLVRLTESEQKYQVTFRPNESSGLARTEIYDWAETLPSILEANEYAAAVVMIGTNDRRDIQDNAFRSAAWAEAYKQNVGKLLDVLKNQGVKVIWASNPAFADQQLNDDMVYISGLQKEIVEQRAETFVDLYTPLLGADGKYSEMGADETGTVRRLRSRDGFGFYKQGNNRMAQIVLGALQAREADETFEGTTAKSEDLPETPLLARPGIDGEAVVFETKEIAAKLEQVAANESASEVQDPVAATPQTASERMFTTGEPVAAPQGRFDDYAETAPASP